MVETCCLCGRGLGSLAQLPMDSSQVGPPTGQEPLMALDRIQSGCMTAPLNFICERQLEGDIEFRGCDEASVDHVENSRDPFGLVGYEVHRGTGYILGA